MEGKRLKLTLQIHNLETEQWLSILMKLLAGLKDAKKEEVSAG
jgi:transcription-repair coupling factor (superfamily II helicase)